MLVEASERQTSSLDMLKVGRIAGGQLEATCEVQRICPSVGIRPLIGRYIERGKIRERSATKIWIDAASPNGHGQTVGDLEAPERRYQRAGVASVTPSP